LRMGAGAARALGAERFAVRRLARLAAQQGPSRAAEELLSRAVELDGDDRDSARALADVEKARGDDLAYLNTLDQLLRSARRTFDGPSREAQLCSEMAEVLRRIGDLDGAQARLREALDAAPDDGPAWRMYGAVLLESGAHRRARGAGRRSRRHRGAGLGAARPQAGRGAGHGDPARRFAHTGGRIGPLALGRRSLRRRPGAPGAGARGDALPRRFDAGGA